MQGEQLKSVTVIELAFRTAQVGRWFLAKQVSYAFWVRQTSTIHFWKRKAFRETRSDYREVWSGRFVTRSEPIRPWRVNTRVGSGRAEARSVGIVPCSSCPKAEWEVNIRTCSCWVRACERVKVSRQGPQSLLKVPQGQEKLVARIRLNTSYKAEKPPRSRGSKGVGKKRSTM